MSMLLLLRARQVQAGADWDTVTGITVAVLLIAGVAFLLSLVFSRLAKRQRFRNSRRRHGKGRV